MTLRRKVGSSRSVLASSRVPARTRCAVGATKSSGSSDCATPPSCHQRTIEVANKGGPPGYLYCEFSWLTHTHRWPCGGRCAACPNSGDCSNCGPRASSVTACFRPVWRAGCCSIRTAPPARGRSPPRSPCCICRTRCSGRSPARCSTGGTGGWCSIGANLGRLVLVLGIAALLLSRRRRSADPVRRVDRQRLHPVRLLGPVGRAARRGATRPGGDDELGCDGHRRRGGVLRRRSSCWCPAWLFGADDTGAAAIIFIVAIPVALALLLSLRFPPHVLGPHASVRAIHGSVAYAVATGWLHGARTVLAVPTVAGTLAGLAAHRMVLRHQHPAGAGHGAAQRHP